MNAIEQRVLDAIDVDGMLAFLLEVVGIPSLSGSADEVRVQQHIAAWMRANGFEVDQWEIDFDTLKQHLAFSCEVERERGLGVVGAIGEDRGGKSLIFNGHCDVVPAGDAANWTRAPWGEIADGRVYGRGGLDMKAGLVCGLFAAKAIRDANVQLRGRLLVQSVIGEEDGGCGMLATILRGHVADGAVIMEPTELCVAPAQAGSLGFRLTIHGLSAHGCVREEGVSAIEKFHVIHQALLALEAERNARFQNPLFARYKLPYPLSIGKLESGNWSSSVPELLTCEGRYGIAVGENSNHARREFEDVVAAAAATDPWMCEHPPVLEWWGGQFESAGIPTDDPIVTVVTEAFGAVNGREAMLEGMTYGADMRHLVRVGLVPTVMFGPGDVRLSHKPDEYVPVDDLVTVVRTLALTALRFCEYEEQAARSVEHSASSVEHSAAVFSH